jgi:hypothetical protein
MISDQLIPQQPTSPTVFWVVLALIAAKCRPMEKIKNGVHSDLWDKPSTSPVPGGRWDDTTICIPVYETGRWY